MPKAWIIYVCDSYFPYGAAYSSRVLNFCRLAQFSGYECHVIADYTKENDIQFGYNYAIDGISYEILGDNSFKYRTIDKYHKMQIALINKLDDISNDDKIYVVINSADADRYGVVLNCVSKYKNASLVLEACEWFDPFSYTLKKLDPRYRVFSKRMKKDYLKVTRILAISSLLQNYFIANGCKNVIRIPTILDISNIQYNDTTEGTPLRFMFAGALGGNKEIFTEFLYALLKFSDADFFFDIYGGTEQELRSMVDDNELIDRLQGKVICHGMISQSEVNSKYQLADYSVIFRPDRRSSHAGFPTKLAESFAAGTPVIANDTGDISRYLQNGVNGYLVKYDRHAIYELLLEIFNQRRDERIELRKKARNTAEEYFDYQKYKADLSKLLND